MIQDFNRIKGIKGKSLKFYHTFASSLLDSPQMGPRFNGPTITVTWILVKHFTKSPSCHDGSMGQTVYFPTWMVDLLWSFGCHLASRYTRYRSKIGQSKRDEHEQLLFPTFDWPLGEIIGNHRGKVENTYNLYLCITSPKLRKVAPTNRPGPERRWIIWTNRWISGTCQRFWGSLECFTNHHQPTFTQKIKWCFGTVSSCWLSIPQTTCQKLDRILLPIFGGYTKIQRIIGSTVPPCWGCLIIYYSRRPVGKPPRNHMVGKQLWCVANSSPLRSCLHDPFQMENKKKTGQQQFCWCPLFGMVSSRDDLKGCNGALQRSGIKKSRLESPALRIQSPSEHGNGNFKKYFVFWRWFFTPQPLNPLTFGEPGSLGQMARFEVQDTVTTSLRAWNTMGAHIKDARLTKTDWLIPLWRWKRVVEF